MATVRGCNIPNDRYYWVEKHVWIKQDGDLVSVGISDVAQSLASSIVAITAKRVGRTVKKAKSVATVESGKWVGPVPTPVEGEVVEVNPALAGDPEIVNRDPYDTGWIVKIRAANWDEDIVGVPEGDEAVAAYETFLEAEGIECT